MINSLKKNIPNMLTCSNLISGCIAVYFAFGARFKEAFLFIIIGAIFDFFDGMVARLLHVSSPIGKELDSLADVIYRINSTNVLLFCNRIVCLLLLNGATNTAICGIYLSRFFSPSTCKIQLRRTSNHLVYWSSNTSKRPLLVVIACCS